MTTATPPINTHGSEQSLQQLLAQVVVSRQQLLEAIPVLKPATLSYLLRNSEHNGLAQSGAVLRPGKEFVFDLELFLAWYRSRKAW
ncbi:hypothetical protein [Pseudomonas putida]|uniref:hypothetical protein n=1 Tax=Pseudomonas putida TaxID=303 RepID=UPI003D967D46